MNAFNNMESDLDEVVQEVKPATQRKTNAVVADSDDEVLTPGSRG